MVGLFSPSKDQNLYDEAAIKRAVEEAARFLKERQLRNVFVDLVHEYNNPERMDQPLMREPDGAAKKAKLTQWFKAIAPEIEVGVCPAENTGTEDEYPGHGRADHPEVDGDPQPGLRGQRRADPARLLRERRHLQQGRPRRDAGRLGALQGRPQRGDALPRGVHPGDHQPEQHRPEPRAGRLRHRARPTAASASITTGCATTWAAGSILATCPSTKGDGENDDGVAGDAASP